MIVKIAERNWNNSEIVSWHIFPVGYIQHGGEKLLYVA